MRVVSWNVGRIYTPTSNNKLSDEDVPRVGRSLAALDADVILLQELVHAQQLERLLSHLPGYAGRMSSECRYDRHVAALARESLAPQFSDRVLEPTGRGLVTVHFSVNGSAARGSAHAVHLDAFHPHGRRSQARAICALTDEDHEPVTVIGGDFNLDPDWAARTGHQLDCGTFDLFAARFRSARSGPTLMGLLRVDHLLARGPRIASLSAEVPRGHRLPLGDHDPVVCEVGLRTNETGGSR